jgi:hypothetical protein
MTYDEIYSVSKKSGNTQMKTWRIIFEKNLKTGQLVFLKKLSADSVCLVFSMTLKKLLCY